MFAVASVGCGRWKAERSRSGAYRATKEVAKRQSRHPTEAGASVPFTTRDERLRREASRAGAKSAQAGRGTEHPLVPVVWRMRLGTLLFCEAPPMTAAFADRLPCSISSGGFATFSCRRYRLGWMLCSMRFGCAWVY